ncbi:MAG: M13 family peptidase [Bacilli bacterium]|nr:M13 family peptidase [Bacilli bacterium]
MEKVRIQDDLFYYVNGEKLETLVIPDDKPTAGGFADLAKGVEETMISELNDMAESQKYPNEYLRNAVSFYRIAKDVKKRNKQGIKPALKSLNKIEKLKDVSALNRKLAEFTVDGTPLPFNIGVSEDMMDTTRHCLMLQGPSVILPDVTYYKEGMESQKEAILGMWSNTAKALLAYTPLSKEDQEQYVKDAISFDALIATLVKSSEEWSEYTKLYNPMPVNKVARLLKPLKFKKMLEKVFGYIPETIIVAEPRWLKGAKTIFNEETFTLYKHWAYINELIHAAPLLSEELRELGGSYRRALMGIAKCSTAEKAAYNLTSSFFSEPLGLYYGKKYFGEEAKQDVVEMVTDIIETYKNRIKANDFLSPSTKEKAVLKLSTMKVKMGYPDKVDPYYDRLLVDENASLYANYQKLSLARAQRELEKLNKPVDRSKWVMPGHMVNACYNPFSNDITFPAAILQAPFYSIHQTRSENLGGIGAVIGHEISHAFDNNGAKCDENGNLKNWWTKEDFKKFNAKTKAMIKQWDGIELPWGKVNGALVVSENIADNGGMACTLDIMSHMWNANYEEYFMNWARVWCIKAKPEYAKMLLSVDVHSPAYLRANMQPRNFEEWYQTFGVKRTDKMYITPKKRIKIW